MFESKFDHHCYAVATGRIRTHILKIRPPISNSLLQKYCASIQWIEKLGYHSQIDWKKSMNKTQQDLYHEGKTLVWFLFTELSNVVLDVDADVKEIQELIDEEEKQEADFQVGKRPVESLWASWGAKRIKYVEADVKEEHKLLEEFDWCPVFILSKIKTCIHCAEDMTSCFVQNLTYLASFASLKAWHQFFTLLGGTMRFKYVEADVKQVQELLDEEKEKPGSRHPVGRRP